MKIKIQQILDKTLVAIICFIVGYSATKLIIEYLR